MTSFHEQSINYDDYINTTAIFGEVKKNVISKSFRGGRITNLCGETKIYLGNADINGTAIIDISQLFGEVKIWVPTDWHVVTNTQNIFADAKDTRKNPGNANGNEKILILTGTSLFAVVKIFDCA
ncbi:MAG: LiaF domain-containing protein [Candidatus Saccharimonadales bacterium]